MLDGKVAANLFDELQNILVMVPDYRRAYHALNRVFQTCIDQKLNLAGIRFGGSFAKTDYLLKEYQASKYLRVIVNDARVRLKNQTLLEEQQMADNLPYDVKAVSLFVSLLFNSPVPSILEVQFPAERQVSRVKPKAECLRVIVNRWNDTYFYAQADAESTEEIKVFYAGTSEHATYKEWDWTYLRELLEEGCQMNLIRPKEIEGVYYPELMIWEPDYLVDISAIASCFEDYACSPMNYLINKIKPSVNTSATVLGQLASQFLDETLYNAEDVPYSTSVQNFYGGNALSLLTTELNPDFHSQAQKQKQIIRKCLNQDLKEALEESHIDYDPSQVIVEPSFFSEMLGIQGRMDFLQLDQKVLIEQKSGKGGFPQTDPDTPVTLDKHYAQLMLYWILLRYNYREQYEQNQRNLQTFLLYSKYRNGLISLGSAPDLIFTSLKIRNEIAANEFKYSYGGIDILAHLTAEQLNEKHVKGTLWERYQKPQLEQLLTPVRQASELERAYYLRFLTFLETEHLMAKIGNQSKENSGFADKWYSSLEDKALAGNIYYNLALTYPSEQHEGKVERVRLKMEGETDNDISNFRIGDIVILYPYKKNEEPDARKTMVFRCTIEDISSGQLTLHLRSAQANANMFWHGGERKWAVEHDFFESSYSSLYRGMHAFLSAPQMRKDLLLLQREPQVDKSLTLTGDYGAFNDLALKVKQARELFIIIGPPGTGKTSYGLLNTLQEELRSSDDSILLLSYTNRAVDEICSKLVENHIDFIRIGGRYACEEVYRPYLIDSKIQECQKIDQLRDVIRQTRVFVGTTTAYNSNISLFKLKSFGLAVIDEASQILEPHLIGLLSAKSNYEEPAIRKIVLIGDHKQLPAVVQQREEESKVSDERLNHIHLTDCRLSLFERLLKQYRHNPDVVYMLTKQGRMHQDIAQFPNQEFYQGRLEVVPLAHQNATLPQQGRGINGIEDILTTRRIAFMVVPSPQQSVSDKVNANESKAIAATVIKIYEINRDGFDPLQTVGVIVPYRNQIAEIRKEIDKSGISILHDITIDTVERYQGSQRDYIIYGFTIQKYYQFNFLTSNVFEEDGVLIDRKLNVAMTRAREHLLIFGNPELLANNYTYNKLLEYCRCKQAYFSVSLSDYIQGRFTLP